MANAEKISTQEALAMIAEVFEEADSAMTPDRTVDSIDAWDSMGILTFMAELDSRFGITINAAEFAQIQTVEDILGLLKNNGVIA